MRRLQQLARRAVTGTGHAPDQAQAQLTFLIKFNKNKTTTHTRPAEEAEKQLASWHSLIISVSGRQNGTAVWRPLFFLLQGIWGLIGYLIYIKIIQNIFIQETEMYNNDLANLSQV